VKNTDTARIIAPEEFHNRFRAHWERTLGNVYTRKFAEQWYDLALTFNAHIEAAKDDKAEEQYSVLAAPLGSGKTQGAILYAVMLAEKYGQNMPGVLIVTRRIADADAIEGQVNEMVGKHIAKADHWVARRERGARLEDLPQYPVLIVTHVAYQDALDALWQDGMSKWPDFCRYGEGSRALCVIDEAIDLVTHDSVGADRLRVALGYIPYKVRVKFSEAIAALNDTQAHLDSEERLLVPGEQHTVLHRMIRERKLEDLSDLLGELGCTRLRDCGDEQSTKKGIGETLRGVERIWRQWSYLGSLPNGDRALHTARLILPPHTKGAIILDAPRTRTRSTNYSATASSGVSRSRASARGRT
jgi:hypothetical protein